jgi:hypothetical protein
VVAGVIALAIAMVRARRAPPLSRGGHLDEGGSGR